MNLHTNDTLGKRLVLQCSKAEVADLDWPCWTGDKDVIALEITVNHWRRPAVKEQQTFEDLTTPVLENFQVELLEPLYVPTAHVANSCTDSTPTLASRASPTESHYNGRHHILTHNFTKYSLILKTLQTWQQTCSKVVTKDHITHTWHVSLQYLVKY